MNNFKYALALNEFSKFGPQRFSKLRKYFRTDYEQAFKSDFLNLTKAGIEEAVANEFSAFRKKINPDKIIEDLEKNQIKAIIWDNKEYPEQLLEIYSPPPVLYYRGNIGLSREANLAMVGSRKFSPYGKQTAEKFANELARAGLNIVSGLALGIDTISHLSTLEAGGGTIAVLGSGLCKENLYPSQNRYLAEKIINQNGLIISEFPPQTPPLRHHFPQRNRIISGLCLGTLVIEAGEKSGTLITANFALEQNREVFAVPGNIFSPNSAGTNELIKAGAKAVTKTKDITETLDISFVKKYIPLKKPEPTLTENEKKIMECLSREPAHIDEIIRKSELDSPTVNSALAVMEIKGMAKNLGGMKYVKN